MAIAFMAFSVVENITADTKKAVTTTVNTTYPQINAAVDDSSAAAFTSGVIVEKAKTTTEWPKITVNTSNSELGNTHSKARGQPFCNCNCLYCNLKINHSVNIQDDS